MKKSLSIAACGLFLAASLGAANAQSGGSGSGAGSGKINNNITGQPTTPQSGTMNSGSKVDATTKTKAEGSQAGKTGSDTGQTNTVVDGTKNPGASGATTGAGTGAAAGGERKAAPATGGAGTTTQTK
jgi:hypothetical protein